MSSADTPVFSDSYAQARERFLHAARARGLPVQHHVHPLRGLEGEELALDVLRDGPPHARHVLLISSACHGAEGFCGSGVQVSLLRDDTWCQAVRDSDVAVVYAHALNPHGFSWLRRVTHEGVDLNRNFHDFSAPLPRNAAYARLHQWLVPDTWPPPEAAERGLQDYAQTHGAAALQAGVSGGQYSEPLGLFYGGNSPTWSHQRVRDVLRTHAGAAAHLAWIDIHTGLGPCGVGERIYTGHDDPAALQRARAWWGPQVTSLFDGSSSSAPLSGLMWTAAAQECPQASYVGVALEYGSKPLVEVINALRADHWMHARTHVQVQVPPAQQAAIRRQMRETFYVDTPAWKDQVLMQAHEVAHQGLQGLRGLPA